MQLRSCPISTIVSFNLDVYSLTSSVRYRALYTFVLVTLIKVPAGAPEVRRLSQKIHVLPLSSQQGSLVLLQVGYYSIFFLIRGPVYYLVLFQFGLRDGQLASIILYCVRPFVICGVLRLSINNAFETRRVFLPVKLSRLVGLLSPSNYQLFTGEHINSIICLSLIHI